MMTSGQPPKLKNVKRDQILADFKNSWQLTEDLFSCLRDEGAFLALPPHGLRHPLIFYYGHTAVFYINKLRAAGALKSSIHPEFEAHFAVGVDEHSWDDMNKNSGLWPSLEAVREFRTKTFETVAGLIDSHPDLNGQYSINESEPLWALMMAIEHDRVHLETTSVLIRELALTHVRVPERFPAPHSSIRERSNRDTPKNEWIEIPAGEVELGKPRDWPIYGWDCESGWALAQVPKFSVTRFLISNGEFRNFIDDGGYINKSYWSDEGWAWRNFKKATQPAFWVGSADDRRLRLLFEEVTMPWSWPAIVNFHEAKAFTQWKSEVEGRSLGLISEVQHHRLRQVIDANAHVSYESWFGSSKSPGSSLYSDANFNLRFGSEWPVDQQVVEDNASVADVFGNVWQWCDDVFSPLEGFVPHSLYPDYSTPSFDQRHQLLLGGSFMSTGEQSGPWVRTNFRRHFMQHAGFRLTSSEDKAFFL